MDSRIRRVEFDDKNHRYFFDGKELKGITGAIGRYLGKKFPDTDRMKLAALYGADVHKEIEKHYNNGGELFTEAGKKVEEIISQMITEEIVERIESEVMVSDFESTASKVDIVIHLPDNRVWLLDIKTTSKFDRAYCSFQLSVYKKLYEECYGKKVEKLFVIGTKSGRCFTILPQEESKVARIIQMNKE